MAVFAPLGNPSPPAAPRGAVGFARASHPRPRGVGDPILAPEDPVAPGNAITEAITFHENLGPQRKAARLRHLKNRWMERVGDLPGLKLLTSADPEQSCAIGTMNIDGFGAQQLTDHLYRRHHIHARPRFVADEWEGIRVTPNVFTTLQEVDAFADAIIEVVRRGL